MIPKAWIAYLVGGRLSGRNFFNVCFFNKKAESKIEEKVIKMERKWNLKERKFKERAERDVRMRESDVRMRKSEI